MRIERLDKPYKAVAVQKAYFGVSHFTSKTKQGQKERDRLAVFFEKNIKGTTLSREYESTDTTICTEYLVPTYNRQLHWLVKKLQSYEVRCSIPVHLPTGGVGTAELPAQGQTKKEGSHSQDRHK